MAEKIERELLASKEISQIEVLGYPPVIIAVDIRENDLLKYGLSFNFISNVIRMSNIDLSGGSVKTSEEEIIIRSMNRSTDPEIVKEIVIFAKPNGDVIKLKDIADDKNIIELNFKPIIFKIKLAEIQSIKLFYRSKSARITKSNKVNLFILIIFSKY